MDRHHDVIRVLQEQKISYDAIEHEAVGSCEDSLGFRHNAGWTGASSKCILLKAKGRYDLLVTTAEKEIRARLFKKEFGTKDIRFATGDELMDVTGCQPGSVPPFGHKDPALPIYVDEKIFADEYFMFNPAVPTQSIRIRTADLRRIYERVPNPVSLFGEDENGKFHIHRLDKT